MKTKFKFNLSIILCAIIIYIIPIGLFGQYSPAELDSVILAKMERWHFPGLQACIINKDSILWKGNYGYANIDLEKPVGDSTLFIVESLSKPVTATAIMQLWEKDLFNLDDDVNDYLPFEVRNPSFPEDSITFRMLLAHTSSITDNWSIYPDLDDLVSWGKDSPISLRSFLEGYLINGGKYYTSNSWDNNRPGSQFNYTNVGITLLGYLLEIISNTNFEDYFQKNIFVPLEMNNTSWFLANLDANQIATPYIYSRGNFNSNQHWGEPIYPAVQIRTSTLQLARFIMAFIQKGQVDGIRILESLTVDSMITVQYPKLSYWGLCWSVHETDIPGIGPKIYSAHTGTRSFGANAGMGFIVNEDIGAIILTNGDYADAESGIVELAYELFTYGVLTDIEHITSVFPEHYNLSQNFPNPFNPTTNIEYRIPDFEHVELSIYNLLGQKVATLVDRKQPAGKYQVQWDASGFASGIYIYQLTAKSKKQNAVFTKKLVLLK